MSPQVNWSQAPASASHWACRAGIFYWICEPQFVDVTTFADVAAGRGGRQEMVSAGSTHPAPSFGYGGGDLLIPRPPQDGSKPPHTLAKKAQRKAGPKVA